MSERARNILVLAVVAAAIVVGFVVASPGGDDDEPATRATTAETAAETTATETGGEPEPTGTAPAPRPRRPRTPTIRISGGKPDGGVRRIRVDKGDQVRFNVRSDVADHVHVHGYDIFKDVAPGATARFGFKADIEGVFEVELEDRGEEIIRLTVNP